VTGARERARLSVIALGVLALGCGNGQVGGSAHGGGAGDKGTAGSSSAAGSAGVAGSGAAGDAAGASGGGAPAGTAGASGDAGASGGAGATGGTGTAGGAGTAGASGGAGAAGAGAGTGGAGGAGTGCAALICEDFEKTAVGAMPGAPFKVQASKGTGTVSVDDTRAHGGTHSVKLSITATTATDTYREAYLAVTGAPLIPLPDNHVYGRFMLYTDRIPDKTVHWTIAHGTGPYMTNTATYNYGGMGGLMANYYRDTSPANDCWQTKQSSFPTGRWVCVGFEFDGPGNAMRFSLDGADVPEVDVVGLSKTDATCTVKGVDGRWLAPTAFKNISIGWESYQHDAMGAHDAWIDDVALDTKPIACP
jgi:hypothetical protein